MQHFIDDSLDVPQGYMHPYSALRLWRLIDKARWATKRGIKPSGAEGVLQFCLLKPAFCFFVTSGFEKGLKQLKKAYRIEELDKLKEAIVELSLQGSLSEGCANFRTADDIAGYELGNDVAWLIYKVFPGINMIIVSIRSCKNSDFC